MIKKSRKWLILTLKGIFHSIKFLLYSLGLSVAFTFLVFVFVLISPITFLAYLGSHAFREEYNNLSDLGSDPETEGEKNGDQ